MGVAVDRSIDAFDRDEWNALFPGEIEDFSYYRAVEQSGLAGFEWLYLSVRESKGLRAVVPAFVTDYRLDTTLSGAAKRATDAIARIAPRLFAIPMVSLGSPVAEICHLGFAADCDASERRRLADAMFERLLAFAAERRIGMIAVKDARGADDALWSSGLSEK